MVVVVVVVGDINNVGSGGDHKGTWGCLGMLFRLFDIKWRSSGVHAILRRETVEGSGVGMEGGDGRLLKLIKQKKGRKKKINK